jgi:hypothetical protein
MSKKASLLGYASLLDRENLINVFLKKLRRGGEKTWKPLFVCLEANEPSIRILAHQPGAIIQ